MTKEIIEKLLKQDIKYSLYGNGEKAPYRRLIDNNIEYTLVGDTNDFCGAYLYAGEQGATVTRLKEGRREDNLIINGERTRFAYLIANNIKNENDYNITY